MNDPVQWYAHHGEARTLVGCAMCHVVSGTAEDLRQAKRTINRAVQMFMATGMNRDQAVHQVIDFAQSLAELE